MSQVKEEKVKIEACMEDAWLHYWSNANEEREEKDTKEHLVMAKGESKDINDSADEKVTKDKDGIRSHTLITANGDKKQISCTGNGEKTAGKYSQPKQVQEKRKSGALKRSTMFILKQRALERAAVSETISNLCEYQCPKCNKIYLTKNTFNRHLKKTQHATNSVLGSVINFMIKIVAHKCFVCKKRLVCETVVIREHLKKSHNVTLKVYCDNYNLTHISHETQQQKAINELITLQRQNNTTVKVVENLCKFNCKKCQYSCQSWTAMRRHLKERSHGFFSKPVPYLTKAVFHQCYICQDTVPCDYRLISNHIQKHNIKISVYKHFLPQKENLRTRYLNELKTCIQDIPTVKPQDQMILKPHCLPDQMLTCDVGNIVFFKCPACSKSNMSYHNLRHHYKKHEMSNVSYNVKLVVEARYHKCIICQKIVLCDNHILKNHLCKGHKINLSEYMENYVRKSGNKVFPTFKDYCLNNDVFTEFKQGPHITCPFEETKDSGLILPDMISSESDDSD